MRSGGQMYSVFIQVAETKTKAEAEEVASQYEIDEVKTLIRKETK